MPEPNARVFVVVLNYLHSEDTLRCVASLRDSTHANANIVVVDNGSPDEQVELLRAGLAATTLLPTGTNLGYAAGNNVGIRHALEHGADLVWILNPDTTVEPATLARLVQTASDEPDAGILGSRVLYGGSRPPRIWFDGGIIDWGRGAMTRHRNDGLPDADVAAGAPYQVDYVTGAAMLVRRQVFDDVGLLPEHYFLYFEETDFNLRAQRAGWRTLVDPRSRLTHHKRSTGRLPSPAYVYYFVRNRIVFGHAFGTLPVDDLVTDVDEWVQAWRAKITEREPAWLDTYDHLVRLAIADARIGRTGPREDLADRTPAA